MMVHLHNTAFTRLTVVSPWRFVGLAFAAPALLLNRLANLLRIAIGFNKFLPVSRYLTRVGVAGPEVAD